MSLAHVTEQPPRLSERWAPIILVLQRLPELFNLMLSDIGQIRKATRAFDRVLMARGGLLPSGCSISHCIIDSFVRRK